MKKYILIPLILFIYSSAFATEIRVAWDPVTASDLAGYKIYYGQTSRAGTDPKACGLCGYEKAIDVKNVTTASVVSLLAGKTYWLSATAYDQSGNESAFSNEISALPQERSPVGLTAQIAPPSLSFYFYPAGTTPTSFLVTFDQQPQVEIPAEVLPGGAVRLVYPISQAMATGDHTVKITAKYADGTTTDLAPQHILKINSTSGRWSYYYSYISCDNNTGVCR